MIPSNVYNIITDQILSYGKQELAKKFPRDFEVYMCALELVDQDGSPVDFFLFPVMPRNISKNETESTSIQHSFSGITIFNKDGYIPDELTIDGDFGRSFKLINNQDSQYYKGISGVSISDGYYTSDSINTGVVDKKMEFPYGVKTGFGCIKILQSILHKAKSHGPTGITYKLFFYNPALGENYLVVPTKSPLTLSQNEQSSNMVWQYRMSLVIIADLADVEDRQIDEKSMKNTLSVEQVLGGVSGPKSMALNYARMISKVRSK